MLKGSSSTVPAATAAAAAVVGPSRRRVLKALQALPLQALHLAYEAGPYIMAKKQILKRTMEGVDGKVTTHEVYKVMVNLHRAAPLRTAYTIVLERRRVPPRYD